VALAETLFGEDAGILRRRQFRLLLLANINAALGTALVSPLLEALTGPFAVSDVRIGLLMTAFTAPPIVGIPLVGVVSDRYGRKPVLVAGLTLFGLSGAAIGLISTFEVALALRVLQGVGYAGITPVIITSIGDLYTGSAEATAQGLRFTSSGVAQATVPLVAGVIVSLAWQYPFLIYAMAVPIAVLVALYFEETGAPADDSAPVSAAAPDGGTASSRGDYFTAVLKLLVQPKIAAVLVAFTVPSFLYIAFLTYNSFLVVRILDGTPGVAGVLIAVLSVIYAAAASQAGRVTDYFGSRVRPLVAANLLMGLGISVAALAPTIPVVIVGVAIMGLGVGLSFSLLRSVLTRLAPETYRGGLIGVGESIIRLANSVAPVVVGWLIAGFALTTGSDQAIRYSLLAVGIGSALVGTAAMIAAGAAPSVSSE
jgi:ACDE family multidrug resistance protein